MNETVLLIEDSLPILENTAEILELSNYKVYKAQNGKQGLELAREKNPDIILCDIMMPGLDGYGVLSSVQNIPELIGKPFVFLTALADKADFRKGMDNGADDYLTKPFSETDLLRVVATQLKKNSLLRKTFTKTVEGLNSFISEVKTLHEFVNLSNTHKRKKFRKKDSVYLEGDVPNFLYFIASGKIKVLRMNTWGKEMISGIFNEGSFFGYTSLLEGNVQKETAAAIEDSEIILISKQDFLQLMYSNNEVSIAFIKLVTNNLDETGAKLIKLAYDSARKKVAEALVYISGKYNKTNSLAISRENIASIAGLSPESVSRNLTDLRDEGLIETANGMLNIKDLKKLETLKW